MDPEAASKPLRFGCPACGIRLVVDQSIAGTEGPCPSCGARIVAPPAEVTNTLVEKKAAPVAIKPRKATARPKRDTKDSEGPNQPEAAKTRPEPMTKTRRSGRAVSPHTIISEEHKEQQNTLVLVKIIIAVVIVALIAIGTYYALVYASRS